MLVKVSKGGYRVKPNGFECSKIQNYIKETSCRDLDFKQLSKYIENGYSFVLADFKENGSLEEGNIQAVECLALDVDSKENPVNMFEFIQLLDTKFNITPVIAYRTFSDENFNKFRLIYQLENAIDTETYRTFYKALIWKIDSKSKFLDKSTCYPSKLWAGTNKEVYYKEDHKKIKFSLMKDLITRYLNKIERENKNKITSINPGAAAVLISEKGFIKKEYKPLVREMLIDNISILDFIKNKFGGSYKKVGNNYNGSCPLPSHKGDRSNKAAFSITENKHIYTCYSCCGTGNIITLAKMFYKSEDTSYVYLTLAAEYGLNICDEWIIRKQ